MIREKIRKMVEIKNQGENWVITIPKGLIGDAFVQRFLERIELENLLQDSTMTPEQAWELSGTIKKEWWEAHREAILRKIREA
jgi:hypothetical protein